MVVTNGTAVYHRLLELKDQGRPKRGSGGDDLHPRHGLQLQVHRSAGGGGAGAARCIRRRGSRRRASATPGIAPRSTACPASSSPIYDSEPGEVRQWTDVLLDDRDARARRPRAARDRRPRRSGSRSTARHRISPPTTASPMPAAFRSAACGCRRTSTSPRTTSARSPRRSAGGGKFVNPRALKQMSSHRPPHRRRRCRLSSSASRRSRSRSCARSRPSSASRSCSIRSARTSSVMLHLALKAFYPAKLPFPLLHVDTTWKFREMIAFRDATARELGLELLVHVNQEGLARGINPIASGSALHTQVMKTEALQAGARPPRLRRGDRRRAPRRGEEPRQGAHLLVPQRRPRLGPAQPAAGAVAPVQHPARARRIDARVSAVELDRARRLGIHRGRGHPGRAALFRRRAAGGACATAR